MVKEIVWTRKSLEDRYKIYLFWAKRNKSEVFSKKLELLFYETAKLVSEFPDIGLETEFHDSRVKSSKISKYFTSIKLLKSWYFGYGTSGKTLKS